MRLIFTYLVPLALPIIMYAIWVNYARKKNPENPMAFFDGPWVWAVAAGIGLLMGTLMTIAVIGRHEPGADYVPPRMEDGRVVPGEFK